MSKLTNMLKYLINDEQKAVKEYSMLLKELERINAPTRIKLYVHAIRKQEGEHFHILVSIFSSIRRRRS